MSAHAPIAMVEENKVMSQLKNIWDKMDEIHISSRQWWYAFHEHFNEFGILFEHITCNLYLKRHNFFEHITLPRFMCQGSILWSRA
jgi:hypothetical protein